MKVIPLEQNSLTFPELAEMAKEGTVILTRNGEPLLSVKNVSGSDWESVSLASDPGFMTIIEESRRSYRETGGIGLDDVRRELGLSKGTNRRVRGGRGKKA
jgi:hypothetical protein